MKPYLKLIDTNTRGNRYDVTPLFASADAFAQLIDDLAAPFENDGIEGVAAIDALGFILGTALARRLGVGIIPIRKGGKLPVPTAGREFRDYSGKTKRLEVRRDAVAPQARILLVDEWIETGAQILTAAALIEECGGMVAGVAAINMDHHERTADIRRRYRVHTVWED